MLINKLYKQSNTKKLHINGGIDTTKFFVKCKDPKEINTWLEKANVLDFSTERVILKALLNDERFQSKLNIIIKISDSETILKEYDIANKLNNANIPGFIIFICILNCNDELNKYKYINSVKEVKVCENKGSLKNILIMPFIPGGSFRAYTWELHPPKQLISCLIQLILSLTIAFTTCGFLHSDIHLDNVLLRHTSKKIIKYENYEDVYTEGLQIVIMDFDKSFIGVNNKHTAEFYKDIQKIIFELIYTMKLTFTNQEIITQFLTDHIFINKPISDIDILIKSIKGIKDINKKSLQNLQYNPNVY